MISDSQSFHALKDAPLACHEIDCSGTIVRVNSFECALLGRDEAEILGAPVWNFVSPEGRETFREAVLRKLDGNESLSPSEGTWLKPGGGRLTLEIYDQLLFAPDRSIRGLRSFLIDVSQRRMTEQVLEDSERRYRHLVENASDIVYRTDRNGCFTFFNPIATSLLDYRAEELVGRSYLDLVRPDYRQKMRNFYRLQLAHQTPQTYTEFPALKRDGSTIWFGQNVQLVREGAKIVGFQAITRDITRRRISEDEERQAREDLERRVRERTAELEVANDLLRREIEDRKAAEEHRRRLELQIQHAQRLESLGVLAGGIAHDFNNLLTAIMGNASIALSLLPPDFAEVRQSLDQVLAASHSAADLTRQMLAYSGRGKFLIEEIDLSRLVRETSDFVRTLISKKAEVTISLAPGLPQIQGDAAQIRQVLVNLLTNASESLANAPGRLTISTGSVWVGSAEMFTYGSGARLPEGEYVFIEVKDTGCGMDHETVQRIFDPFFTTKFTGRGLGLAAVLGIVRGHKGNLTVESAPGRGSTFRVLFPSSALSSPDQGAAATTENPGSEWRGSGLALVVDDEQGVRDMAAAVLERAGFTVITAHDGPDAVLKLQEHQTSIDIVVLDLTMPGMDGIEVLQHIGRLSTGTKVVLSSGYNLQEIDQRLTPGLIAGFLRKPYVPSDLLNSVRAAIGGAPLVE